MVHQPRRLPPISQILDEATVETNETRVQEQKQLIERTLAELGVEVQVHAIHQGPTVTQFSLKPGPEVQLSNIKALEADIALALSGLPVQIEEPSPGHPELRIVVPRLHSKAVKLRDVLESAAFQQNEGIIKVGLGLDTFGKPVVVDLTEMPHLLIGGTTGSGKSVCLNAIIASLLCTYPPDVVQFLMIDPLRVELKAYNGIPHLFVPVITLSKQVAGALEAINQQINGRFTEFSKLGVRDIAAYNRRAPHVNKKPAPYLVLIIDNLTDLMMSAAHEVEPALTRITAMGRSAGVHLVFATQRSNVDVVSGAIKANASGRIAFKVTNSADSRLVLDASGAEDLLGPGDMLYKAPHITYPQRIQGVYVAEAELARIIRFWRRG